MRITPFIPGAAALAVIAVAVLGGCVPDEPDTRDVTVTTDTTACREGTEVELSAGDVIRINEAMTPTDHTPWMWPGVLVVDGKEADTVTFPAWSLDADFEADPEDYHIACEELDR
ncbi:hypothetical protein FNH13_17635 [Ornithinimicrobium ciconiae]|uniref:Uncharacterized protein n=1 Tax=Ornithinimicrobium ciconiae TaxID=2594265 RepID=A0A516GEG2_9MICO|nr:hypothetical protein [Ornithinimicrobium ciconiae]QDO89923.1 hypothetical protein FNH13_17635 [Ornithinimicrobium ciconiae]